jgi:hypothetical protein
LLSGPAARFVGLTELYDSSNKVSSLDQDNEASPGRELENETTNRLNAEKFSSLQQQAPK